MNYTVSVIIPAFNAEDTIGKTIQSVFQQNYSGQIEIVIVDDGSTDQTAEIVRSFPEVRLFQQQNAGPASARNHGAREAKGDIFLFTDSDCCPERDWVALMLEGFVQQDVAAVAGSYEIANEDSALARTIHAEIVYRHHHLMPEYVRAFGSYNVGIRRDIFQKLGGFNEEYREASGEDNDFSYRLLALDAKILFQVKAKVAHYHQTSLFRYLKEQFRHGFWRMKMYLDHPDMAADDDYTFWKDTAEVFIVLAHVMLAVFLVPTIWMLAVLFLIFEVVWGWVMTRRWDESFLAGGVMWLRSFARSLGLFCGGFSCLWGGLKKDKKS